MRRLLSFSLAALSASAALAAAPATATFEAVSGASEVDSTTQTEDVGFTIDPYERMTVPVRLGGTGPYRFLVDTGADRTAISRDVAAKLQLKSGARTVLHSIAGASNVTTATVPSLELTRKEVRMIDAPVLERGHMGADGILGVDSLQSQRILFDFETKTMSVVPAASPDFEREPGSIIVRGKRRNGRLVLTHATANGRRLSVVIDTGSQVSIGNQALRKAVAGAGQLKALHPVEVSSVTGAKIAGEYMILRSLEVGGVELRDLAVVFADSHAFKKLGLDDKPAMLLGMNAMRVFKKVSIDFGNRRLRVVLPEHSALDERLAQAVRPADGLRGGLVGRN